MGQDWEFNAAVTDVFDEMLNRSIPQYEIMREAVLEVGTSFVRPGTVIIDLGTSRGEALAPLIKRFGAACEYIGVETSKPMAEAFKARFADWMKHEPGVASIVRLFEFDLRVQFPFDGLSRSVATAPTALPQMATLVQSILTLMFTPINYRQKIVRQAYEVLQPGGAFILVEKVLGEGWYIDALQVAMYHEMKKRNGYSREEIDRKRLALEGIQVPVTARWNEELLRNAGFTQVDCFWRWMNFAAWVAIK